MTEKEFIKITNELRRYLKFNNYRKLTCVMIKRKISHTAFLYYREYIKDYLYPIGFIYHYYYDESGCPMLLRCMLTEAFFEECLNSGKYKEF